RTPARTAPRSRLDVEATQGFDAARSAARAGLPLDAVPVEAAQPDPAGPEGAAHRSHRRDRDPGRLLPGLFKEHARSRYAGLRATLFRGDPRRVPQGCTRLRRLPGAAT